MSWGRNRKSRRGVALVFALFTISLLVTMSATVVALAIRHGRTSHSHGHAEAALHAANWGVEAALNYMGVSQRQGEGIPHWTVSSKFRSPSAGDYNLTYRLAETKDSQCPLALTLTRAGTPQTVYARVKPAKQPINGNTRLIQFSSGRIWNDLTEHELLIDGQTKARVQVLVTEYQVPGQPSHFGLVSTARVLDRSNNVVATRVVEARVREQTALDFMHFIQNARAWDVNGVEPNRANTKDIVGLPEGYREDGRMRVDGGNVGDFDGSIKFFGRGLTDKTRWKFTGEVSIRKSANPNERDRTKQGLTFTDDGADSNPNTIFLGGLKAQQDPLGLPQDENYVGYARSLAQGKFNIDIKGDPSSAYAAVQNPSGKVPDVYGKPLDLGEITDENERAKADARPSFAKIVVTLNGSKVTIDKVNPGAPTPGPEQIYSGSADGIPNGIISVQGGNVEVKSALDNKGDPVPFTGKLTIVSSDNPDREQPATGTKSYPYPHTTIYSDLARKYYEEKPHLVPPYRESDLVSGGSSKKYLWPTPHQTYEREGNLMVTSDIVHGKRGDNKPAALGLIAQNFVLLNDKNSGGKNNGLERLEVEAVLMSLDHSVQFDWENMARSDKLETSGSLKGQMTLLKPRPPASTPIDNQRVFRLNGAIVSSYLDVEGDNVGRGYFNQQFTHDPNLRFQLPPYFPRWDRSGTSATGVVWNWVIMNYVDKGTLNQFSFD